MTHRWVNDMMEILRELRDGLIIFLAINWMAVVVGLCLAVYLGYTD